MGAWVHRYVYNHPHLIQIFGMSAKECQLQSIRQGLTYEMIDLGVLRSEIKALTRRKALYKVLKEELGLLGYWQNKPRGNPSKGLSMMLQGKTN